MPWPETSNSKPLEKQNNVNADSRCHCVALFAAALLSRQLTLLAKPRPNDKCALVSCGMPPELKPSIILAAASTLYTYAYLHVLIGQGCWQAVMT